MIRSPRGTGLVARTLAAGVAAAAAVGVFAAPPARAAGPMVTISSPASGAVVDTAVVHIAGEARMGQGGTVNGQIVIKLESLDGHPAQQSAKNANSNPAPFEWNPATAYNGRYRAIVTATGRDGAIDPTPSEPGEARVEFSVRAAPAPPANLRAAVGDNRYVELNWDANVEPDLVGYQVQRSAGGNGAWEPLVNTSDNFFTDMSTANAGGDYSYRVVAVRRGLAPEDGVPSDPSGQSSVEVDDPPAGSTPTTSPGGTGGNNGGTGGGGGTNGGTGGGGGTSGGTGGGTGGTNPELARTGKVDLSGFSALLENASRPGPGQPGQPAEPDGTFGKLPFQPGDDEELGEDGTGLAIGIEEAGEDAAQKPVFFFAASMLVTVVLMHVIWLKRQVDAALPALPVAEDGLSVPEAPSAGTA